MRRKETEIQMYLIPEFMCSMPPMKEDFKAILLRVGYVAKLEPMPREKNLENKNQNI